MLPLPKIGTYSAITKADETLANFIKRKHPKERGRKKKQGALLLSAFVEHKLHNTHLGAKEKKVTQFLVWSVGL
jgi:hypothetical protein